MKSKKSILSIALIAAALALAVAGCGSSSDSTGGVYGGKGSTTSEGSAAASQPASGSQSGVAIVTVNTVPKLGKVVVDSKGMTLYDFHKDKGTTSSCYGGCAAVWPPLTTEGQPTGQMGVPASKLGTTTIS